MKKIVFLDRDGVINVENNYTYNIDQFEFIEGVFEACRYLRSCNFELIIVTNQSGIGRGYYSEENFKILTKWMLKQFKNENVDILDIFYCAHSPRENCLCRKPAIGMKEQACQKYKIDLANSWLIGDKQKDIEFAINSKIGHSILVGSGHKFKKYNNQASFVLNSLADISQVIG